MGVGHEPCCNIPPPADDRRFATILKISLALNFAMFIVEMVSAYYASSASLQADALDFLGDSASYATSLLVLGMHPKWRSRLAVAKGALMAAFGIFVLGYAAYKLLNPTLPDAAMLSGIGLLALLVNIVVAAMLFRFHQGDSNQQSVWICSRNDAIGNILVIIAGGLVYWLQSGIPDIIAAVIIASLALRGAWKVIKLGRQELQSHRG